MGKGVQSPGLANFSLKQDWKKQCQIFGHSWVLTGPCIQLNHLIENNLNIVKGNL